MSDGMPELGSKISLISKADIRYEGRLYTVDPQECTIALSNVRSFGTEDRETQFQIAPQSQIYDYILFRGSDIKDIRVVNNSLPHPNDPAIMQVQLQNGQHIMPHFPMPSMNPPHPPPMGGNYVSPFGAMGGLGMGGGGSGGAVPSLAPGSASGPFMLGNQHQQHQQQQQQKAQQQQQQQQQQQKQPNMLASASRSTTPISLLSRKSPSADTGVQVNQQQQHHQNNHQNNAGQGGNSRDAGHKRQNHQQRVGNTNNNNQRNNTGNNNDFYQQSRDRRDSGRNTDNYNNHDARNNYQNHRNQSGGQGGGGGGSGGGGGGQNRAWTMHRGPNNNTNNMNRNRGGGGGGGGGGRGRMPNQGYRPMGGVPGGGNQNKPRNAKNTIKFEQDFDFEQANNKFEEIRSHLSKLKVGDEPKTEQMNGETDKKDDSGNETGAGEHEHEDEEITVGYDKTKSFFDNISCEAAQDRTKNKKNDWRQERKLNSETFGVSSTRRGGNFRGRGNYYNRNGGNYGGGYNRGYRGGYRNRSNNRMGNGSGTRDNSNSNANTNNNNASTTNASTNAEALKNQAQQAQTSSAAAAASTGTGTPSATSKSTPQENNTQPQVAAVGAGQ